MNKVLLTLIISSALVGCATAPVATLPGNDSTSTRKLAAWNEIGSTLATDVLVGVVPPDALKPIDAVQTGVDVFHIKPHSYVGVDVVDPAAARFDLSPASIGRGLYVDFGSAMLTKAVEVTLAERGVKLVSSPAEADLVLRGYASYWAQSWPYPPRRFILDQRIDEGALSDANLGISSGKRSLPHAAYDLAPAYVFRGADPITFSIGLVATLIEQSGLSAALRDVRADELRMQQESYLLMDCYDKDSRKKQMCISEGQLMDSYRRKIRVEAVDLRAYLGRPEASKSDYKSARIIARRILQRADTEIHMAELLGHVANELSAGEKP